MPYKVMALDGPFFFFFLQFGQLKGNNSCISKDILLKLHVHHPTSYLVKYHEVRSIPFQVMAL